MDRGTNKDVEELLLRLSEFGAQISMAMSKAAGPGSFVDNISLLLLCRLDLDGPMRPSEISELEHMTTGGVSKLIDRMEAHGLVERKRGVLPYDKRAVLVVITAEGRRMIGRVTNALADRLNETQVLLKEIERLLPA